jgi:hypothetical protein
MQNQQSIKEGVVHMWKKKWAAGTLAAMMTLGGLTACGDGVDQDNGVDDGKKMMKWIRNIKKKDKPGKTFAVYQSTKYLLI